MKNTLMYRVLFALLIMAALLSCSKETDHHARPQTSLTKIVYVQYFGGSPEFYMANYDGTGQSHLNITLPSPYVVLAGQYRPELSSDRSKIFFVALNGQSDVHSIFSCDTSGANLTRIVDCPDASEIQLGQASQTSLNKILYAQYQANAASGYYLANYDGTGQTHLNINLPFPYFKSNNHQPSLSYDGSKIFFIAINGQSYIRSIFSCDTSGANLARIIDCPDASEIQLGQPSQTSLNKILYAQYQANAASGYYLANYDGTGQTHLNINLPSPYFESNKHQPALSYDGSKIFFIAINGQSYIRSIFSCDTNGTNLTRIIDCPNVNEIQLGGAY